MDITVVGDDVVGEAVDVIVVPIRDLPTKVTQKPRRLRTHRSKNTSMGHQTTQRLLADTAGEPGLRMDVSLIHLPWLFVLHALGVLWNLLSSKLRL